MKNRRKQILFIAQYSENISPGQRFRIEQYATLLTKYGFAFSFSSFLNPRNYDVNYKKGFVFLKAIALVKGFCKRLLLLFTLKKYDYIFIYREAAPVGPPVFEWLISKLFHKKIIYDFDDAIWMPYMITESSILTRLLKNKGKVKKICRWAYKVSCGNQYLCNYAKQYNSNVAYNPTCVDTKDRYNIFSNHNTQKVTVGWTGSFSTLNYLEDLGPVLQKLQEKYDFNVKVICNRPPALAVKNLQYVEWNSENEIAELASCHIGLMPLTDEEWSKGKCGFKLIQYMALEIAPVASPVGVNSIIVDNGVSGFLCSNEQEWYSAIEKLLTGAALRQQMGKEGRRKIVNQYSVESNEANFLGLFN